MSNLAASIEAAPHQSSLGSDHMNKGSQQIQPSPWDPLGPLGAPSSPRSCGGGCRSHVSHQHPSAGGAAEPSHLCGVVPRFWGRRGGAAAAEGREGGDAWNIGAGGNRLGVEN